jgi:hypothetical protein
MKSHELLRSVVDVVGTKQVAFDLKMSASLVYKWCSPWSAEDGVGVRNPLDRITELIASTGDRRPVEWLCDYSGGFFVESSKSESKDDLDGECLRQTQTLLSEFSELLQAISLSQADESGIDSDEATVIRAKWQSLESRGEAFVRSCEHGRFDDAS